MRQRPSSLRSCLLTLTSWAYDVASVSFVRAVREPGEVQSPYRVEGHQVRMRAVRGSASLRSLLYVDEHGATE